MFCGIALADIPSPPVGEEIRIELDKSYSDYQFYLCSYDVEVKANPNPPHPSRPTMIANVPGSFQMKKIDLSGAEPFILPIDKSRVKHRGSDISSKAMWLVAVKKSSAAELESKIQEAVDGKPYSGEIKLTHLEDSLESRKDERTGAKVVVNRISIDEKGMTLKVEEGNALVSTARNCIGVGLILTAFMIFGGLWVRKSLFS